MSTELQRTGSRLVFETMGTTVSVVAGAGARLDDAACEGVRRVFDALDERFSLYKPASEATAVAQGRLAAADASQEFREALALSERWERDTAGAFTATAPDGHLDLSGVVKALAIEGSGQVLDAAGVTDWAIGCGGDVLTRGLEARRSASAAHAGQTRDKPWVVGLVDPADRQRLVSQFTCSTTRPAVATSGSSERGEHIWRTDTDATFVQASVAGPDIITADVLATAIVAGGPKTYELVTRRWPVEVLAFTADGRPRATRAFLAWPGRAAAPATR